MRSSLATVVAVYFILFASPAGAAAAPLTLDQAFQATLNAHPDLARFRHVRDAAAAELDQSRQPAALELGTELENVAGTGTASGLDRAEITLSLASVLERGGKRQARIALAQSQFDAVALQEESQRLDLLAEVARRYLDCLSAQALDAIWEAEIEQRQRTVELAGQRLKIGASPESAVLAAEAAAARARLQRQRVRVSAVNAKQRLAILWNDQKPAFETVAGELLRAPSVPSLESLIELLDRTPQLRRFADESRLREARLQLARSSRATDVTWQVGARRLEETDDWAAVASVSIPFGASRRAEPSIRVAQAELSALEMERTSEKLTLYATLLEAHTRLSTAAIELTGVDSELLPRLEKAERAAERAYRAGAVTYLEWAQLQSEVTEARRERVLAAIDAHRALIEIQRLTGNSFLDPAAATEVSP